jgi:hypothetical protein
MRKVTLSDSDSKSYVEYENFEDDYETSNHRSINKEEKNRRGSIDRSNTYGHNFNPRINQHYEPQTGGNYNDPRANDRRDSNPYQFTYNDNNNANNRNNFYSSRNNNDGRRNDSNDSNLRHERDRACILQCFFQELKMVKKNFFPFLLFRLLFHFYAMPKD